MSVYSCHQGRLPIRITKDKQISMKDSVQHCFSTFEKSCVPFFRNILKCQVHKFLESRKLLECWCVSVYSCHQGRLPFRMSKDEEISMKAFVQHCFFFAPNFCWCLVCNASTSKPDQSTGLITQLYSVTGLSIALL